MKQFLKLAAIFVSILLVIVATLCFNSIMDWVNKTFGPEETQPVNTYERISNPTVRALQKELEEGWKARGGWDEAFFKKMWDKIDLISVDQPVATQRNYNTEEALRRIYDQVIEEWGRPNCNKVIVDGFVAAARLVQKTDSNAAGHQNITQIEQINKEYNKALTLVNSKFVPKVSFNGSTWKSYSSYEEDQRRIINNLKRSNNYIQYLSNIIALQNGLGEPSLTNRFNAGRGTYYNNLSKSIRNHFEKKDRTPENLDKLFDVRNRYDNESPGDGGALSTFVGRFNNEVYGI